MEHVETQILQLCTHPDFGYGLDNYLFSEKRPGLANAVDQHWHYLSLMLRDELKFKWLLEILNSRKETKPIAQKLT